MGSLYRFNSLEVLDALESLETLDALETLVERTTIDSFLRSRVCREG